MSFKEWLSTAFQYGKDISSPEVYLSECERILNAKYSSNLSEEDVLKINSEL